MEFEFAHRPGSVSGTTATAIVGHTARRALRHDADTDVAFDQPADGIEAAQLPSKRTPTGSAFSARKRCSALAPVEPQAKRNRVPARTRSCCAEQGGARARSPAPDRSLRLGRFRARSCRSRCRRRCRDRQPPSAIRPTISSLRRSCRSTLTLGCAEGTQRLGQELGERIGVGQHLDLTRKPAPHRRPRSSRRLSAWRRIGAACCGEVRPACVGVTPWRERTRSEAPSVFSMLRSPRRGGGKGAIP